MLTNLILKKFVPESDSGPKLVVRAKIGRLEAWWSITVNAFLAALKLAMGLSISSLSLIADAVHTISDVASSIVVLFGFRISVKPADKEHPFGHGRAEYIATLIIAIMLGVIGFEFIKSSTARLITPVSITAGPVIMIALAMTVIVKYWLGEFSLTLGRIIDSTTLKAEAWHHRSDALSSIIVLLAVWGSTSGYPVLDGVGGILVGFYLIGSGLVLAKEVIDPLMGAPPTAELVNQIRELSRRHEKVFDAHDISIHNYGHHKFIGLHAEVSCKLSVQEAHDIAETVSEDLQEQLGAYTTVHIDPIDEDNPEISRIKDRLMELMSSEPLFAGFQDLRLVATPQHKVIIFEVIAPQETSKKEQDRLRAWLVTELSGYFPGSQINIQVAPLHVYR
ncbi:MAG: cation transporter [Candidatus Marinimicrobia bacterium]|nr:cation transporter [Candidatus Neomarinimicrobiota bacterium]